MSYKVTEEGNIATIHLDGEIDMDVTEKAKKLYFHISMQEKKFILTLVMFNTWTHQEYLF